MLEYLMSHKLIYRINNYYSGNYSLPTPGPTVIGTGWHNLTIPFSAALDSCAKHVYTDEKNIPYSAKYMSSWQNFRIHFEIFQIPIMLCNEILKFQYFSIVSIIATLPTWSSEWGILARGKRSWWRRGRSSSLSRHATAESQNGQTLRGRTESEGWN